MIQYVVEIQSHNRVDSWLGYHTEEVKLFATEMEALVFVKEFNKDLGEGATPDYYEFAEFTGTISIDPT